VTLIGLALYAGLPGLLYLVAQDIAAAVFDVEVSDPVAFRQWGVALLILALLAALLASDPIRYRRLLWVPLLGLPLESAVLASDLVGGTSGLRQLGAPLVVGLVLFVLLVLFYPRGQGVSPDEGSGPGVVERRWRSFLRRKADG
jgi:hypothetical protein